jgi:hypothetical protein
MAPDATRSASHAVLTSLSRPEKPPSATTSTPESSTAVAALDWLDTAIAPPPFAAA